jgi:hypothetical protein
VVLVDSCLKTLQDSTKNVGKFKKTIYANTVFDLISETDLTNAKSSFKAANTPKLEGLISGIHLKVVKLKKQKVHLSNKYNLNHLRLTNDSRPSSGQNARLSTLNDLRIKKERMKQSLEKLQSRPRVPNLSHPEN